jgi:hypothetical protein
MVEMGFNRPVHDARLRELMDEFAGAGPQRVYYGFAKSKSLRRRSQSIPEFDSSRLQGNYHVQWKDAAQNLSERSVATEA